MDYKEIIADILGYHIELNKDIIVSLIEIPPNIEMGDFSFPCFNLVKTLKKSPSIIAEEIRYKIYTGDNISNINKFEKIEALGPYINFFLCKKEFIEDTVEKILREEVNYGKGHEGKGKNIIVEYCSANISKPLHVGHMFTTIIGNSLYKIFHSQGYNPIGVNHIGDWGIHLGKLIYSYKLWGNEKALAEDPMRELLRVYIKFHEESENDPSLDDEGRKYFTRLEKGEEEEVTLWSQFKNLSLREFNKLFHLLKVKFDSFEGESFYNDKIDAVINELDSKGLLMESNGAKVVLLKDENIPPYIIKKGDGGIVYTSRDLAVAFYRKTTINFYKNIYVVGKDQCLHFKQVFTTIKKMGYDWAEDCIHASYGLVRVPYDSFYNEKKNAFILEDLLKDGINRTEKILKEEYPKMANRGETAEKMALGAIIFTYLKNPRERDVELNWNHMLNSQDETGPYVQKTYAKGIKLLKGIKPDFQHVDYSKLNSEAEFQLVKELYNFNTIIKQALDKLEPYIIARYIISLTKVLNSIYNSISTKDFEDKITKNTKLALIKATLHVIKNGLDLMGVETIDLI